MPQNNTSAINRWSVKSYGTHRGIIITLWHQFLFYLGRYSSCKTINWSKVRRLVFVCKGNICRSAFAQVIAHNQNIESISFGLDTIENAPANKDSIMAAEKLGIDLNQHKTTTLTSVNLEKTDLLLAMELGQIKVLNKTFKNQYQTTLLSLWMKSKLPYIQDPHGMLPTYFEKCFLNIRNAVEHIAGEMEK
jgi:protein-tyrosine phosphatase